MHDLIVGKKYKVRWLDCCVEGEFTAVLIEIDEYDYRKFNNGVVINDGHGYLTEEVTE